MADNRTTTDHDEIRRWVEERGGRPALSPEHQAEPFGLRIEFPEDRGKEDELLPISWEEFFQKFDDDNLVFLYRDEPWVC